MRIALNRMHFPVTTLGPGTRLGIWLQGCGIACPGCVSRDTWSREDHHYVDVETILEWCRGHTEVCPDGVTISGGEPFEQPEALNALLDGLAGWRREAARSIDFLCYSGLPFARLQRDFTHVLTKLDAIVPEPYVGTLSGPRLWRGSANQKLIALSELGQERYAPFTEENLPSEREFQVQIQDGRIWFIGIPGRNDMEKLEAACAAKGLILTGSSWRA